MGQYNRYKHTEARHYKQQLLILYKIFKKKGYEHIQFLDTRRSQCDLKEGVDVIIIAEYKGIIQHIPISLRSREDRNERDISIRRTVNFGNSKTEFDKIMDGSSHCRFMLFTWHLSRIPDYLQFALISTKQMKTILPIYDKPEYIIKNRRPDGSLDGSSAIFIPVKELCVMCTNIK